MTTDRRISRRIFVAGGAASVAGVLAARSLAAHGAGTNGAADCGCVENELAARGGSLGAPAVLRYQQQNANIPTPRNQTLVVSQSTNQVWDSFNPFIPNGEAYEYGVSQTCRECPFYANFETGKIIPWLATKYEYSPDFTQMTLSLNPAAKWSDGQPYTSDDYVYTIGLLQQHANYIGADQIQAYVASVTAPNANTVVFKLKQPNPRFHYNFIAAIVNPPFHIVPKHVWEKQDPGTFKNNPPIYTGPYVLDRAIPSQFMQVWKRNPNYWNAANLNPKPQYVIYRQFLPVDAETQEFTRGNVDIPSLPYLNMVPLKGSYKNWEEYDFSDPCPRGMWLNQDSPSGIFQKAEGRWAMSYLLDRKTIGTTIWQPPTPPAKYPWAAWKANDKWEAPDIQAQYPFDFDIAKAGQLLDSIGAKMSGGKRQLNGKAINLDIITPVTTDQPEYQIAQMLSSNLKKVGIDSTVRSLPGTPWTDAYELGHYDVSSHWLCGESLDPDQLYEYFLTRNYVPVGQRALPNRNETRTRIPELNDIAVKLEGVNPDDPKNKPLFDQGLAAFMKNLPAMPSVQTTYPFAFGTQYWKGWPTAQNNYNIAANWWAQFMFVIGTIEPTGS